MNPRTLNRLILWSIIGIGVSSVTLQILTVREFLAQFEGNEITISLALFCWLVCTGLGSLAAKSLRRPALSVYSILVFGLAIWPLAQIAAIRLLREVFFSHGTEPGFYAILVFICALSAPYALLSGFILPYALKVLQSRPEAFTSGDLYIRDSLGDIAGGAFFSFWLIYWAAPFQTLAVTSTLLLLVALLLMRALRRYALPVPALLLAGLFFFAALHPQMETRTLKPQYGAIVVFRESPYGRIVITREADQYTFWENGRPFYSNVNPVKSEEKIHYALSQLEEVGQVLLISGGLGETMAEIRKYGPAAIDYLELDPQVTSLAQKTGALATAPDLRIINQDGRAYLRESKKAYDAVIVDLPDPDTFQLNRFFTLEFMALVKQNLRPGGIFSFSLGYSPNYQGRVTRQKLATALRTARSRFRNVLALPGEEEVYFICRDGALRSDIAAALERKNIATRYIAGFYEGTVTPDRLAGIQQALDVAAPRNSDFQPRLVRLVFQEWFLKQGTSPNIFFGILLGLTIVYLVFLKKAEYVLFTTGFVAMGAEMTILFMFQAVYGYVYLQIGAIVTAFLAGLLPGAVLGKHWNQKPVRCLRRLDAALVLLLLLIQVWLYCGGRILHPVFFLAYGFAFSFLCGYQFPLITTWIGEAQSPAAGCLAADLIGAAIGTLFIGAVLIPAWGMGAAIWLLAAVKLSSLLLLWKRK